MMIITSFIKHFKFLNIVNFNVKKIYFWKNANKILVIKFVQNSRNTKNDKLYNIKIYLKNIIFKNIKILLFWCYIIKYLLLFYFI